MSYLEDPELEFEKLLESAKSCSDLEFVSSARSFSNWLNRIVSSYESIEREYNKRVIFAKGTLFGEAKPKWPDAVLGKPTKSVEELLSRNQGFHAELPTQFRFLAFYSLPEVPDTVLYTPLCAVHASERADGLARSIGSLLSLPRVVLKVPQPRPRVVSNRHSVKTWVRLYDKLVGVDIEYRAANGHTNNWNDPSPMTRAYKQNKIWSGLTNRLFTALPLTKFNEIQKWQG